MEKETIFETILKVRIAIGGAVEKDGTVTQTNFSYKYASHNNIVSHVRKACNDNSLIIIPQGVASPTYTKNDTIISGNFQYTLANKDGDTILASVYAAGEDKGDKFAYKLDTGAMKYLHIQLFMLATDLDPENPKHEVKPLTSVELLGLLGELNNAEDLTKLYSENKDTFDKDKNLLKEIQLKRDRLSKEVNNES